MNNQDSNITIPEQPVSQNVIIYDTVTARYLHSPKIKEIEQLYKILSYTIDGYEHAPQAKKFIFDPRTRKMVYNKRYTGWDGIKHLYNKKTNSFPVGLIHRALQITPNVLLQPTINGIPRSKLETFETELKYPIYRHQRLAFEALSTRAHGMVEIPTGGGKSMLIAMLARSMKDGIGLITVPSRFLLHQTKADIEELLGGSIKLGIYGDNECDLRNITVATIQSLQAGCTTKPEVAAWLAEVDWWLVDETHGAAADSYHAISDCLVKAMVRYGVTATCWREDQAELLIESVIGPLIYREEPVTLIKEGILCIPEVEIHFFEPGEIDYGTNDPHFKTVYKKCVVEHEARNNYILNQVKRSIQDDLAPVLVLVDAKEHGRKLAKLLKENKIPTEFIYGEDTHEVRMAAVNKLVSGKYKVLVASGILNTGVNIPPIRTIINASAGMSKTETTQKAGRGLRISPNTGKTKCRILDLYDDEPRYLRRHARMRRSTYQQTYSGYVTEYQANGEIDRGLQDD